MLVTLKWQLVSIFISTVVLLQMSNVCPPAIQAGNKSQIGIPSWPTQAICGAELFLVPSAVQSHQYCPSMREGMRWEEQPVAGSRGCQRWLWDVWNIIVLWALGFAEKTPWDKWPSGTRTIDMAFASNLGLLRAHGLLDTCKKQRPHFLVFYYCTKIGKI